MSATLAAPMRWMTLLFLAAIAGGCSNAPSEADCEKLLDKTLELDAAEAGKSFDMKAEDRAKYIRECVDDLPRGRVACALKAESKQQMVACDEDEG